MKLISSAEAVAFLSQAAPRPWVQRLLRWMAFDEGLRAYTRKGIVQPHSHVIEMTSQLLEEAGERAGAKMDGLIREEYSAEIASRLVGKDPLDRFDDDPFVWDENEEPIPIDIGFFLYADEIDWEGGILKASVTPGDWEYDTFFENSPFLETQLADATFEATLEGICFEAPAIEMLLPSLPLGATIGFTTKQTERRGHIGRPPKWDWEGAIAHIASIAQHPDGLPTGPGAQARVEELIAEWFANEVGETPSASQVRQRAAKIMSMIETPKSR